MTEHRVTGQPLLLTLFTAIYITSVLVSNTISAKVCQIGPISLPVGILIYPLGALVGDVVTEVYGYRPFRQIVWSGVLALIIMNVCYVLATLLPPVQGWEGEAAFAQVLTSVPRITLASLVSTPVGMLVNARVLVRLKERQRGRQMSLRFLLSTMVGQAIDSVLFIVIAFAGVLSVGLLAQTITSDWACKVIWECIALAIGVRVAKAAKRRESVDV